MTEQYERATSLLTEKKQVLGRVAEALLEHEVLDGSQLRQIMNGEKLEPRPKAATRGPAGARAAGHRGRAGGGASASADRGAEADVR